MKYWQKVYACTLLLFLLALNAGAYLLASASYDTALSLERERGFAEHGFIADALERDIQSLRGRENVEVAEKDLLSTYAAYYAVQGLHLALRDGAGKRYWGEFDLSYAPGPQVAGVQAAAVARAGDALWLYVEGGVGVTGSDYSLVTARSLLPMQQRADALTRTLVLGCAGLSLGLAFALWLLLRKLTQPIRSLSRTASQIAGGAYEARAQVRGTDEISALAESFNTMADAVTGQLEALQTEAERRQQFIDGLAHELRTPLTAIGGYAQYLLAADVTEDERLGALAYMSKESMRLGGLADKLLELVRLREGALEVSYVRFTPLLEELTATFRNAAEEAGVTLELVAKVEGVDTDEAYLLLLLQNLVQNALRAGGSHVRVTADAGKITVADDGRGMEKSMLMHITEPFYRVDKGRARKDGGAGLGLALCARIANRLGLTLHFSSAPGEGTMVEVRMNAFTAS